MQATGKHRTLKGKATNRVNPITDQEAWKEEVKYIRERPYPEEQTKAGNEFFFIKKGGIEIVGIYKEYKEGDDSSGGGDLSEAAAEAVIQADSRGNELFDSEVGIPTTETQYVNVFTEEYMYSFEYTKKSGTKSYPEKYDETVDGETVTKTRNVTRSYSYYEITDLSVYALTSAVVENESLPSDRVVIPVSSAYTPPSVQVSTPGSHYGTPDGVNTYSVGEIPCWNDTLVFNGITVMDGGTYYASTPSPGSIPEPGVINENALYGSGYRIDAYEANGEYETTGYCTYNLIASVGSHSSTQTVNM